MWQTIMSSAYWPTLISLWTEANRTIQGCTGQARFNTYSLVVRPRAANFLLSYRTIGTRKRLKIV